MPECWPKPSVGMLAIDTNIVVRYLTRDHPVESTQAKRLIEGNNVFVSMTVILQSEWVMRSVYGYTSSEVCSALRSFAGLETVEVENPACLAKALQHAEAGLDFADALHLEGSAQCDAFVTFDLRLGRSARRRGLRVKNLGRSGRAG